MTDDDGKIDVKVKEFIEELAALEMRRVSATIAKYNNDWTKMYSKLLGQVCPVTEAHLF